MTYSGRLSTAFYGWNATWKSGAPATDKHIPFNPPIGSFKIPNNKYEQEQAPVTSSLIHAIEWTKFLKEGTLDMSCYYRDPFMALMFFPDRTITAAWAGDVNDVITGAVGDLSEQCFLWAQFHLHDDSSTNHINILADGGELIDYNIELEYGKLWKEHFSIQFAELDTNEQACDIDDQFDDGSFDRSGVDGGFSNWDNAFAAYQAVHSKDATITWGSTMTGISIQSLKMNLKQPVSHDYVMSSYVPAIRSNEVIPPPIVKVEGYLASNAQLAEFMAAYDSKTKQTFLLKYDTNKYFSITNMYLDNFEYEIPAAGKAAEVSYTLVGGASFAPTFYWKGTANPDPSAHIRHVSP